MVPGWGTTAGDRRALARLPNVRVLPNARDIDDVLAGTRVLLMPSLWYEGFGLIVMESMLRGIPVVASDSGGLVEAKRGTGLRDSGARPSSATRRCSTSCAMPLPVVPENDAAPWVAALGDCSRIARTYERESAASRAAAPRFVAGLDAADLERYLAAWSRARRRRRTAATMESLSPEKRALLLERLRPAARAAR